MLHKVALIPTIRYPLILLQSLTHAMPQHQRSLVGASGDENGSKNNQQLEGHLCGHVKFGHMVTDHVRHILMNCYTRADTTLFCMSDLFFVRPK